MDFCAVLSQKKIAEILNCQREVYRRYETGKNEIPVSFAIILARYYDVTTDYLLGLTKERKPFPKK
ncbi:MAG TPA: helix-turn-helix transcriptional regulator [Candidatus Merdivicinus excrementipullorum]|uniref:Helix-turn-helix transcriptional regulator n=1 Tax=Candidatus Merdivicinus excrementipullorum TaxID=2840867 RepID=A0A9D1JYW5_9FIRM|nr:helix-turn-helix transcriptional regulator [Candidatus Merdivicinus excrementipullorum]